MCHNFLDICASGAWNWGAGLHEFGDGNQPVLATVTSLSPLQCQRRLRKPSCLRGSVGKQVISTILEKFKSERRCVLVLGESTCKGAVASLDALDFAGWLADQRPSSAWCDEGKPPSVTAACSPRFKFTHGYASGKEQTPKSYLHNVGRGVRIWQFHRWHSSSRSPRLYLTGPVPCNDGQYVCVLMERNLGRAYMPQRRARALCPQKWTTKHGQRG